MPRFGFVLAAHTAFLSHFSKKLGGHVNKWKVQPDVFELFRTNKKQVRLWLTLDIQCEELDISVFAAWSGVNVSGHCWVRSHYIA